MVQFFAYGFPIGGPVDVVTGVASTLFSTWDWPNETIALRAEDCNDAGCGPLGPGVNANVDNVAPTITSPADGATTNATPTFAATSDAPAVGFQLDGVIVAIDASAPFEFTPPHPLAEGHHVLAVDGCGARSCTGEYAAVSFNVVLLHPLISPVAPNPFSPNGDSRDDTATVAYSLPDTESVTWTITDGVGATVQGPNPLGSLAAGSHSFVWSGLDNTNTTVPDGIYTVVVSTAATVEGLDLTGSATTTVTVDTTPPTLGGPTGVNATFYPVHDGYRDTFTSKVSVNEPGRLWLAITTTTGSVIRVLTLTHGAPGTFALTWNGLNSSGHLVAAGTYHFYWVAQDLAGNRRRGNTYNVGVSLRHLVNRSTTVTKTANNYDFVEASQSCATASKASSAFRPYGLLFVNHCNPATSQVVIAGYTMAAPGAISYTNVTVETFGFTTSPPAGLAAVIWNFTHNTADFIRVTGVFTNTRAWTSLGTVAASQHLSAGRLVQFAVALGNATATARYDMYAVRLVITYKVLS
jgi:flagellar hook assembly protein FlgD